MYILYGVYTYYNMLYYIIIIIITMMIILLRSRVQYRRTPPTSESNANEETRYVQYVFFHYNTSYTIYYTGDVPVQTISSSAGCRSPSPSPVKAFGSPSAWDVSGKVLFYFLRSRVFPDLLNNRLSIPFGLFRTTLDLLSKSKPGSSVLFRFCRHVNNIPHYILPQIIYSNSRK